MSLAIFIFNFFFLLFCLNFVSLSLSTVRKVLYYYRQSKNISVIYLLLSRRLSTVLKDLSTVSSVTAKIKLFNPLPHSISSHCPSLSFDFSQNLQIPGSISPEQSHHFLELIEHPLHNLYFDWVRFSFFSHFYFYFSPSFLIFIMSRDLELMLDLLDF